MQMHSSWLTVLGILTAALAAGCSGPPIVSQPPPPAGAQTPTATSQPHDYTPTQTPPPSPRRPAFTDRKPVVSLLRTHDITEFADSLPFGRQKMVAVTDKEGSTTRVELNGGNDAPVQMPDDVRAFLTKELVQSDEVIMVERERILEILREQQFGQSKHVATGTSVEPGRLVGVHYILEAAFFPAGSRPAQESVWAELSRCVVRRLTDTDIRRMAVMYINAYDVETGVITTVAYGAHENRLIAVRNAVHDLLDQMLLSSPPIRVARFVDEDNVVIDIGRRDVAKGDLLRVESADGTEVVELEVWQTDPLTSVAKILRGNKENLVVGSIAQRSRGNPVSSNPA